MKISKKIVSMLLCGFIAIGGSQLSLVKAHASSVTTRSVQANQGDLWREGVRLKLQAKYNHLYKDWWEITLVCDKNGHLRLEGRTDIPGNLTFDDNLIMGQRYYEPGLRKRVTALCFEVGPSWGSASTDLKDSMRLFNESDVKVGDLLFAHGRGWNGTLRFSPRNNVIHNTISNNDFTQGYKSVSRWATGFEIRKNGLYECHWDHDYDVSNLPYM